MSIDATRAGVAASIADYFGSNYEALLQSSAAQQPVTPMAPDAWKNALNASTGVSNANTRFFLKQDGTLQAVSRTSTQTLGWQQPPNSVEVDLNVAYGIESAGLSPTDWLMQRLAAEFRLNNAVLNTGSVLSQTPEPDMNIDLSSLDTASLVRLLNMLAGRSKDAQRSVAIGNSRDAATNLARVGLAAANLANALELQATYQGNAAVNNAVDSLLSGQDNASRDALVNHALSRIVADKHSELVGARLAFEATPAARLGDAKLKGLVQLTTNALDASLQSAADKILMGNPSLGQFGSALDYLQTNDGLLVKSQPGATREQQQAYVKAQLKAALSDPAFKQNLVDAMAANAQALGTADLPLDEQYALYGQVADALIAEALSDEAYLDQLAAQSVQFRAEISDLIGNEVVASRERESVYKSA